MIRAKKQIAIKNNETLNLLENIKKKSNWFNEREKAIFQVICNRIKYNLYK